MSTPKRYQPDTRLIDDPERLRELYCDRGLSIRQIADKYAKVGSTRVGEALNEYDISRESPTQCEEPSIEPPTPKGSESCLDWASVQ